MQRVAGDTTQTGRRRGVDRKREILAAARSVFSEKGYDKSSVAEIAAKVGVVEGAIYKHFATKRELLFEATATFYRPVVEETAATLASIDGTRARLRFVIGRLLRAFADAPGFCRLIIQDVRPHEDYRDSVVRDLNRESGALLLGIIDEAVARGEARPGVSRSVFRDVIFGGIEHVMWKALEGRGAPDVERLADELTDLVLFGVTADGAEQRVRRAAESGDAHQQPAGDRSRDDEDATSADEHASLRTRVARLERRLDAIAPVTGDVSDATPASRAGAGDTAIERGRRSTDVAKNKNTPKRGRAAGKAKE